MKKSTDFSQIIKDLAKKHRSVILCEGMPLDLPDRIIDLAMSHDSIHIAINIICLNLGYYQESKSRIFTLRKTYANPQEIPCITLEELYLSLKSIREILSKVCVQPKFNVRNGFAGRHCVDLYNMMPEIATGQIIPIKSLPSPIKRQVYNIWAGLYFGSCLKTIEGQIKSLENLDHRLLSLSETGLDLDISLDNKDEVSHIYRINGKPKDFDLYQAQVKCPTIEDVCNIKSGIKVHNALKDKPLVAGGIDFINNHTLATLIAEMYKLNVRRFNDIPEVTIPTKMIIQNEVDIVNAIYNTLPYPLTRCLKFEKGAQLNLSEISKTLASSYFFNRKKKNQNRIKVQELTPFEQSLYAITVSSFTLVEIGEILHSSRDYSALQRLDNYSFKASLKDVNGKQKLSFMMLGPQPDGTLSDIFGISNISLQ